MMTERANDAPNTGAPPESSRRERALNRVLATAILLALISSALMVYGLYQTDAYVRAIIAKEPRP